MNFKSAPAILTAIQQMQWASQPAQQNRTRINRLFNGDSPWTEQERLENRIFTNVNFLEPTRIAANSRYQIYNAFFKPGDFFSIRLDKGPIHKRDMWSRSLTRFINKQLRKSECFRTMGAMESAYAQVVLHGPGPVLWKNGRCPVPGTCGVDDVVLPAGTLASMENLNYLSIYREWTWGELQEMTQGGNVDPGWNKKYVKQLMDNLYKQPLQPLYQGNRWLFPEKIEEDNKENATLLGSSSLPRILAWDFYYLDEDSGKWNRRILLDYNKLFIGGNDAFRETAKASFEREFKRPEFLYQRDSYADCWREIIHFFIGNCSNVAPFRYYSIRSIGYLLYGVCLLQNRTRCRFSDAVMSAMLEYFRNVSDDDREKLEKVDLHHYGIIPDGLSFVTAGERHEIDENLVMAQLGQNRQLMAESSANFLPDIAVEGEKPAMTATESLIRNNASTTLTSAVLNQLYNQSETLYQEICRRYCIKGNTDKMARALQEFCRKEQIPLDMLDCEAWDIIPERVMGGGNKAVELTTSRALFEIRGALGQQGAAVATRKYVLALTDDPQQTAELVPEEQEMPSDAALIAASAFGTLMQGVPYPPKKGLNEVDYINTLLTLTQIAAQKLDVMQQDPDAAAMMAEKIAGLVQVLNNAEEHIQVLAMDESQKELVKDMQTAVNKLMMDLRGYAQRLQEAQQAKQQQQGAQLSPEAQAKIIDAQIVGQAKAKALEESAAQKQQHKDIAFDNENKRRNAATLAEINRKLALTQADVAAKDLTTRADLIQQDQQHSQEMVHADEQAEQERAAAKAKPKAASK
jgi:hypothetical protein